MEHVTVQIVGPASPHRCAVVEFVQGNYMKRINVLPPTLPEATFAAFRDTAIVGAIGLEFCEDENCPFPCEHIFVFDHASLPCNSTRKETVQYSRWTVIDPGVTRTLIHTATVYAMTQGKQYGWCELKPRVHAHLVGYGVELHEVPATINTAAISESVSAYYTTGHPPRLYHFRLAQLAQTFQ